MSLFKKKESNQSKKKKEKNQNKQQNKKPAPRDTKKVSHIKDAIPVKWSEEYQCFVDNNDNFILMAKVTGTNIWGLNQKDQFAYLNAYATIFQQNIHAGMIYSYEVPADVEGYIHDYEVLKNTLNVTKSDVDRKRYEILNDTENRLKEVSVTRELVDRNFMIILKHKDFNVLKDEINTVCNILNPYQQTKPATPQEMLNTVYNYYNPTESEFVGTSYFDLDYGKMDLIYPDKLGILQRGLSSTMTINDNVYTRTKWIYTFMSEPTMALLGYCATFRYCDFSLHFEMAPHDIIKRDIDKTINNLNKNLNKEKNASQQAVIEKLRSFNREKSIRRAESREKLLEKITIVDKPQEAVREMHFSLEPYCVSGNDVLTVEHLSKQFDTQLLFQDVSFEIKRGEHVAVIGDNGTGKTTLLKILNQVIKADNGSFTLGAKVQIGYYDQEHHVLHDDKTIFEEISDDYPHLTNTEIRNTLAAFQFTGDEVFQVIRSLSGGEKGRVSLAKLMLSEANFLILDEPTNHLDIASKEILEEALNNYTGTILYVSHDRYFINSTASRILELVNQTFVNYIGNYDYYLEKKEELTRAYASAPAVSAGIAPSESSSENQTESKLSWQEQKEQQAKERKRKNDLKKTEEEIAKLEERNTVIDEELTKEEIYSNSIECQKLSTERAENEEKLEALYERWEELAEEV